MKRPVYPAFFYEFDSFISTGLVYSPIQSRIDLSECLNFSFIRVMTYIP
jgi:hypothetical protein